MTNHEIPKNKIYLVVKINYVILNINHIYDELNIKEMETYRSIQNT